MEIKADRLFKFLAEVDVELKKEIELNAVGGTALTLLGLKTSTIDIDFDMSDDDKIYFKKVLELLPHGFKIDIFTEGYIFCQQLPKDYLEMRKMINSNLKKIRLYTISPLDIAASKISRLNDRDIEDIGSVINKCKIKMEDLINRSNEIMHAGSEDIPKKNLEIIIQKFY